jgi:hypothetical protein
MVPDITPPKFVSKEFHTRFFPQVLRNHLPPKRRESEGTTFTSTTEMFILLAVCVILAIIGIPSAVQGSVLGWILSILGVGGTIALVVMSLMCQRGERPSYGDFLIGVFLFFVILGIFLGIPVGMETHSFGLGLLTSLAGLITGYVIGIYGGLWLQYLGWFAIVINMLAAFGAIILSGTALIMLVILIT